MRRKISFWTVIVACCLLTGGLFASGTRVQAQMPGVDVGAGAPTGTGPAATYARKLPAEAGSVQPVAADPAYRPLACTNSVVNASQTSGNEDESFVVINPTNPNN